MKHNTAQATKVITAHVPLPMADKVDQMAARLERSRGWGIKQALLRSRGWVIKQALSLWLAQEEERNCLTLAALDDVTSGQVIDHQAVQAWADSLSTDNPLPVPR